MQLQLLLLVHLLQLLLLLLVVLLRRHSVMDNAERIINDHVPPDADAADCRLRRRHQR